MIELADMPDHLVSADLSEGSVALTVDAELYPLDALYGAAFVFIDRCYVFLDKPAPTQYRVVLTARGDVDEPAALRALVGEFANELLTCAWRHKITEDNRLLIETVTMQAIGGAMGPPSLDDLAEFDFSDEGFDDPLGIAKSWEDKHGKGKTPPAEGETEDAT
jgi:His-Xaa-Ser system protein HxsD